MSARKKTNKIGRPAGRVQDVPLHVRVDAELLARVDALTEQVETLGIARSGVVRALIAVGLEAAEKDVRVLLTGVTTKTNRKKT